jgi:hypothetical protein
MRPRDNYQDSLDAGLRDKTKLQDVHPARYCGGIQNRDEMSESQFIRDRRYFVGLRKRLSSAVELRFCIVSIGTWRPQPAKCHENVAFWVKYNPQHRHVSGWLVCNRNYLIAHAVVCDPELVELLDITPLDGDGPPHSMRFVRHLGSSEEFCELRNRHPYLNWAEFLS